MTQRQPPILDLKQVSLALRSGTISLIRDVSFEVAAGECLAIVGASGAGKTSLLRLLNRLGEPTTGTIAFNCQPLSQIPVKQLRQQVVLVPQEPKLLGMTVEETLTYPLHLQQLSKAEIQQRRDLWCSRLRLPQDWLNRHEWQLSLGQRQLVSIARALAMEPRVLLLDEPTSALDRGRATYLIEVLQELAQEANTAILMVNHHLEIAAEFAQRLLYLEAGQIIADLPAAKIDWGEIRQVLSLNQERQELDANF